MRRMQTREMKDRTARTPDTALYTGVSKIQDVLALVALFIMAVGLFVRQGVITRVQFLLLRTAARSIRVFLEKAPPKFYVLPFRVYVYIARLYCTRIRLRLCKRIEVMRGSASLHINSVKHVFTVVVYGVVAMLEGRNVLAVLGKVRFIAITHDKRYCLQFDSCQENCW